MAAIPSAHLPTTAVPAHAPSRVLFVVACVVATSAGFAVGALAPPTAIDAELATLLRAMAAIKALLVVAALAVVAWRLGRPVAPRIAIAYGASVAAMGFATALIWLSAFVGVAAIVFHAALFAGLLAAWRDDRVASFRTVR